MNMKRRHSGGGNMNHGGGGGYQGGHRSGGGHRPQNKYNQNYNNPQRARKNYPAMREKYLNQARDAMSSGDRVLAEYYMQHADHCFRMQQEFQAERAARYAQQEAANPGSSQAAQEAGEEIGPVEEEVDLSRGGSALPSFITGGGTPSSNDQNPPAPQNWEEE